jgi:1-acyl-sn-glycerol-3-phosphate acyltransferase
MKIRERTIFDGFFTKYILKSLFFLWFKLTGWTITKDIPKGAGVAIAAPHTSNWDFVYALGAAILQDVKIYFSIKDVWCKYPVIGHWIMYLGGIPIDRSSTGTGQVNQIKEFVETQKTVRIFFLFTPEGTRSHVTKWKTGFYHVAMGCNLPIFLAKVDYQNKEAGVFKVFTPSGNKEKDITLLKLAYQPIKGKFPQNQFPPYVDKVE